MTLTIGTAALRFGWRLAPPSVLLVMGWLLFPSGGHDDTHITCWPAYTLSRFGQILNYNGDRVEQSSSLLQVLVLAALHKLTGVDLVTLAKLTSILCGAASVWVLFTLVSRVTDRTGSFCAAMIAAASTPLVYWSFGGMETSLVSVAGLWLIVTTADYAFPHPRGSVLKATLALSLFALARPETPLLLACFFGSALVITWIAGQRVKPSAADPTVTLHRLRRLALSCLLVCGVLFTFRWMYFGALFPQPVAAKFSGASVRSAVIGLHYLKAHALNEGAATAAIAVTIVVSVVLVAVRQLRGATFNPYVVLSLLFAVGYLCCIVIAGGDWMEGGRFLVHFLPVAIGCVPLAVEGFTARRWALPVATAILLALEASSAIAFTKNLSTSIPLWADLRDETAWVGAQYSWFERRNRINIRDMPLIENLDEVVEKISARTRLPVLIFSGQMGMVPYYIAQHHFGRVRFVDRHGLVERTLTDCIVTRDLPRDTGGLVLAFDRYFENFTAVEQHCQHASPNLVFDIGSPSRSRVEAYGYRSVYTQSGDLAVVGTRLVGATVVADAFIAVDGRLLSSLSPLETTFVQSER